MFKQRILVTVVILTVTIRKMFNVCLWFLFPQVCLVILYLDEDFFYKKNFVYGKKWWLNVDLIVHYKVHYIHSSGFPS